MANRLNILFINEFFHPDICASAVVATDHLTKIARMRPDWRVSVISGNRAWDDSDRIYPEREDFEGIQILRVPRPALNRRSLLMRAAGFAAFGRGAVRAAAGLGPVDVVIGTTAPPQGGKIAATIARQKGCPYIYKVLDLYPDLAATLGRTREGSFIYRRWWNADERVMQGAAAVVTISAPISQRVVATRNVDAARVHTIHDGYDAARLKRSEPNEFAKRHNPEGKFVVQYAGNMGLSHPFETILEVARRMQADPKLLFQFIGEGPRRSAVSDGLPVNARLLPFEPADQLGALLAAADVCLITQDEAMFDQALPYKIYSILAAGKAAIFVGNPRSEIAQWLMESGAGLVVRQGDAGALEAGIRQFRDSGVRIAAGQASRRLFESRFSSENAIRGWIGLLESAR